LDIISSFQASLCPSDPFANTTLDSCQKWHDAWQRVLVNSIVGAGGYDTVIRLKGYGVQAVVYIVILVVQVLRLAIQALKKYLQS